MTGPTSDQLHAAYVAETPDGDTYGVGVGHAILPSGQLIAIGQTQDEWAAVVLPLVLEAWIGGDHAEV